MKLMDSGFFDYLVCIRFHLLPAYVNQSKFSLFYKLVV